MKQSVPILTIRNLHKKFSSDIRYNLYYGIKSLWAEIFGGQGDYMQLRKKEFWVLKDINLDLYAGEILCIVGANGSGKTTLMRIISQIYYLEEGRIKGRKGQKVTPIFGLNVGMRNLFSARENIYIKGAMYGMTKAEIDAKMDFITSFSELGEQLDKPFGNYSSGMKARLAFSIALATEPDIFIIDEALAVGDSLFKAKCYDYLKSYVQQPNKAVIIISHNIKKVLELASRVIILKEGKIIKNSKEIKDTLNFYILNCMDHLNEEQKMKKLKRVQQYEM